MTEWDAAAYSRISALQRWQAEKSLAALQLEGGERVLDVGCGNGVITAQLAARLARGAVVGVDASHQMIDFAAETFPRGAHPNLTFRVADAARLAFVDEFDLIVSFNCLHWVRDQAAALRGIRSALVPAGRTHLRFVPQGARQSLEDVIEETRQAPRWREYFVDYRAPYVHLTEAAYGALARSARLHVKRFDVQQEAWDFGSREAFAAFAHGDVRRMDSPDPFRSTRRVHRRGARSLSAARRWVRGAGERLHVLPGASRAAPRAPGGLAGGGDPRGR
jgi:trans-aconitate 2-methyltransferase